MTNLLDFTNSVGSQIDGAIATC